ncbi:hypothetical protein SanaruYs_22910 [Chryseotalea sanaruensis]|uniref:SusE outer membrane protein domain-containing protein n=2 Tax=Chryseotalea sanaruensis TaxID=2482724 RepID=A0A401UAZ7_9BACT|nr:hypothetical protein SanaruYs_22910 [Chryseotalea sanaruensis]
MDPVGNWELSTPVPTTPAVNANVVLEDNLPAAAVRFEWQPASASSRFIVQYTVYVVTAGSTGLENALLTLTPGNSGKNAFVEMTAQQLDYILWTRCYPAGAEVDLEWVVVAKSIDKTTTAKQAFSIKRFQNDYMPETMFITGAATEAGDDVAAATPMRAHKDAEGNVTNIFDVYTTLTAGKTYFFRDERNTTSKLFGGEEGTLEGCGAGITAPETGQYRITVNLNSNTYSLLKIDRWSLVGDAVEGGWGGDVPLTYQGNSVWTTTIEFYKPYASAGCIFRANGDWGYLLKRIVNSGNANNTRGNLVMESEAAGMGKVFEDVPGPEIGTYKVTLNLAADAYTYLLEKQGEPEPTPTIIGETANPNGDAVSGNFVFGEYNVPNELYLLADGVMVGTFEKDANTFNSVKFWALQASKTYTINSASDGSGTNYGEVNDGEMAVARDQLYQLSVNFETGRLAWKYYNMKLFHWADVEGGWDARQELLMTYEHPYTFKVSGALSAGFLSKFNSPWEVQFGTDGTALSGTMTNGGANFTGIVSNGTYNASIVVTDDFTSCEYTFVKQ